MGYRPGRRLTRMERQVTSLYEDDCGTNLIGITVTRFRQVLREPVNLIRTPALPVT